MMKKQLFIKFLFSRNYQSWIWTQLSSKLSFICFRELVRNLKIITKSVIWTNLSSTLTAPGVRWKNFITTTCFDPSIFCRKFALYIYSDCFNNILRNQLERVIFLAKWFQFSPLIYLLNLIFNSHYICFIMINKVT